jgi:DNA repair photolyase
MTEIVNSIKKKDFDIIYVSQKNDNFSNPDRGIELCEKLFVEHNSNIFGITRNVFDDNQLRRLSKLNNNMIKKGKRLFIGVSIAALNSYGITENANIVANPEKRIEFVRKLSSHGIRNAVLIRPIYPNKVIPITEIDKLIDVLKHKTDCIVVGGLGINDTILHNLKMNENDFEYEIVPYLDGAIDCEIKFVNVREEIAHLKSKCLSLEMPLFEHSISAINYMYGL